jgi:hypothetical protein
MDDKIKSGRQVIEGFFTDLQNENVIDINIINVLRRLHGEGKLTDTNILNELDKLKQDKLHGQN